jgi:hypothetical protein
MVMQQGALAGAVGADQGDDLAGMDFERDAFQRLNLAVEGVDVIQFQQHHSSPR